MAHKMNVFFQSLNHTTILFEQKWDVSIDPISTWIIKYSNVLYCEFGLSSTIFRSLFGKKCLEMDMGNRIYFFICDFVSYSVTILERDIIPEYFTVQIEAKLQQNQLYPYDYRLSWNQFSIESVENSSWRFWK